MGSVQLIIMLTSEQLQIQTSQGGCLRRICRTEKDDAHPRITNTYCLTMAKVINYSDTTKLINKNDHYNRDLSLADGFVQFVRLL